MTGTSAPADERLHRRETADEAEEHREHEATEAAAAHQAYLDARQKLIEHDERVRRFLLRLSLANWGIAVIAWTISAFLGITSPASIIVYSVLVRHRSGGGDPRHPRVPGREVRARARPSTSP